ncbi:UDP-glycosyltransferase 88B1 [Bienertia sinuspersici]
MVELGKLLLSHPYSISSITILIPNFPFITGSYSSYISSVSSSFPSITFLPLPSVPLLLGDPSNYQNLQHITYEVLRNSNPHVKKSLQSISPVSVSAFIIDFFSYSALEVSQSLNIPSYFLFTTGTSALTFFLNFPMAQTLPKCEGIIINTFEDLEVRAVEGLKKGTCLPGTPIPPIYCIGPLIANRGDSGKSKDGERHECQSWLDSQPNRSVVYLAFGSRGTFSMEQLSEIAFGLETSGVRFLWLFRHHLVTKTMVHLLNHLNQIGSNPSQGVLGKD